MNEKHLTQLRKLTRILYVFGASLLLAAMVLSMVKLPVDAEDFTEDSFPPNSRHDWCHCMPNPQNPSELKCNTLYDHKWVSIWNGHIDAAGNNYHEEDYYGACVVPTGVPTQVPTGIPTQVPTGIPTQVPTDVPTQVPTDVPTQVPTDVPTQVPTDVPTQAPTENPPQDPTEVPPGDPTQQPPQDPTKQPPDNPPQDPPQDPNPPAGVLIPVTGVDIGGNVIPFARSLTMNLSILFFGMAMVLQAVTYRISKNH